MTTAVDTETIEHLDFDHEVPCEWSHDDVECDQPADWQITYDVGVIPNQHIFACTPHKEHLVSHATNCPNCSRLITIVRVEPIR